MLSGRVIEQGQKRWNVKILKKESLRFLRTMSLKEGLNIHSPFRLPESFVKRISVIARTVCNEAEISTLHLQEGKIDSWCHSKGRL